MIDDLIREWGREKGINNADKQFEKVIEEIAEIAREIVRGRYDSNELYDAIGDAFVTIIILADLLGINPIDSLDIAWDEIKNREGKTIDGCFVKRSDL